MMPEANEGPNDLTRLQEFAISQEQEISALQAENAELKRQLNAIYRMRSWKAITAFWRVRDATLGRVSRARDHR